MQFLKLHTSNDLILSLIEERIFLLIKHVSLPGLVWSSCIIFANSGNPGEDGLAAVDVFHGPLAEEKVNMVLKIKQKLFRTRWIRIQIAKLFVRQVCNPFQNL